MRRIMTIVLSFCSAAAAVMVFLGFQDSYRVNGKVEDLYAGLFIGAMLTLISALLFSAIFRKPKTSGGEDSASWHVGMTTDRGDYDMDDKGPA
jgi:hypothetical protein